MGRLNRRDFMKALGLGSGASALSACNWDDNRYYTPIEQILPYVVRPEQALPGTPTFFATTVTTGPAAHPVLARHRDGRVIHVGANQRAPMDPAVPKSALLELQRHFSPDRYRSPQAGSAGARAEATWDEGLEKLAAAVRSATKAGKTIAYLGPYRSGAIVELLLDYTNGNAVFWEPLGRAAEAQAAKALFGEAVLPAYDLSKAHYVLSFGAEFLGDWGGAVANSQYARARNPNHDGFVTRFATVTAHLDQTGVNADDWYAAAPGTELQVALAVGKLVAEKKSYRGPLASLVNGGDAAAAAAASGISAEDITAMANAVAAGTSVVLPGGVAGSASSTALAIVTYAINIIAGNGGKTFGLGPVYSGPVHGAGDVVALLDQMKAGKVGVLLLDDANPAYALPADADVASALAKVDTVVALSSHPDETNAAASLVLPISDAFEDWGDEEPADGLHLLRQPAMTPMYDTRSLGDILLVTARSAGIQPRPAADADAAEADAAPGKGKAGKAGRSAKAVAAPAEDATEEAPVLGFAPPTWRDYVTTRWKRDVYTPADGRFDRWWEGALQAGLIDRRRPIAAPTQIAAGVKLPAAEAIGDGDLYLVAFPDPHRHDGRYSNQPWAQEVPDPTTGNVWDTWALLSEATAARLGVEDKGTVEVSTGAGKLTLPVRVYPAVRDDVIAVPFGGGHTANGRYADGIGGSVVSLLNMRSDAAGAMSWQQARATVKATSSEPSVVSTFGSGDDHGKFLAVSVSAEELAKVGDKESAHAGDLTPIHHLPRDPRLEASGNLDFYPVPDHPTYRFAMTVDTNACTGCGSCVIACYAENNLPVIGRNLVAKGREMAWLRIDRFWKSNDESPGATFVPMMCQQCGHAPCESVCPVLATYHTIDGLNAMVYNRCVGTRYCANNCPYVARRFNFHTYTWPEPFNLQLNPDVTARVMGVMEKCTFCVQRVREVKSAYRDMGFDKVVPDDALRQLPACAEVCPSQALTFGNQNDEASAPARTRKSGRSYEALGDLNTFPAVNYLARASYHLAAAHGGHGEADATHGDATEHGEAAGHGDAAGPGKGGKAKGGKAADSHEPAAH
jgi:Fe-S-cluster-containing dehydrogenase component/anaerobic selenocysteine-containing dehydrogenase